MHEVGETKMVDIQKTTEELLQEYVMTKCTPELGKSISESLLRELRKTFPEDDRIIDVNAKKCTWKSSYPNIFTRISKIIKYHIYRIFNIGTYVDHPKQRMIVTVNIKQEPIASVNTDIYFSTK